jgi:hypothetical protein
MANVNDLNLDPINIEDLGEAAHIIQNLTLDLDYVPKITKHRKLAGNLDAIDLCLAVSALIEQLKRTRFHVPGQGEVIAIPPEWNLYYAPAYPSELMKETQGVQTQASPHEKATNIITWKIVKRMAGSIDPQPFSGRRPSKPRYRETIPGDVRGEYYETQSKWIDNLIQFDCFAKSNLEAELLVMYMEDTLEFYRDLFVKMGAQRWLHWDRVEDTGAINIATNNTMHVRSFYYYARTERFILTSTVAIQEVINEVLVKLGRSQ